MNEITNTVAGLVAPYAADRLNAALCGYRYWSHPKEIVLEATFSRYRTQPRGEILMTPWRDWCDRSEDQETARARAWPFTGRKALARVLEDDALPDDTQVPYVLVFWRGGDDQFLPPKTVEALAPLRTMSEQHIYSIDVRDNLLKALEDTKISFAIAVHEEDGYGAAREDVLDMVFEYVGEVRDSEAAEEKGAGKKRKKGA